MEIILLALFLVILVSIILLNSKSKKKIGLNILRTISWIGIIGSLFVFVQDIGFTTDLKGAASVIVGIPALVIGIIILIICHFISKKIN